MLIAWLLMAVSASGQTPAQREALFEFRREASARFAEERAAALRWADSLGLPVRQELPDGRVTELMRLRDDIPMYYITHNAGGAELINSDKVYADGSAGLELSGAGQTLGIWDNGKVRNTHQEFNQTGESRVTQIDGATLITDHATHVAGTMVAGGVDMEAKGMAYEACLHAYDWNDDEAEMAGAAAEGLKVSQHSYGYITGWAHGSWSGNTGWHWFGNISVSETEDYFWGFYSEITKDWDYIACKAPYYLISKSAGNSRSAGPAPGTAHYVRNHSWEWVSSDDERELDGGEDGYKSISHTGIAKNILSVGAVLEHGDMASFSSWGPTDDGRLKPDIVAKGVSVYSTRHQHDSHYGSKSGTSMSGPMVAGSIGLILEHQENLHPGEELLSATVKALILHSADTDISGAPGPDYRFGWGLMDTGAAVDIMTRNADMGGGLKVREKSLADGESISLTLRASGTEDLKATIVWTDPPGTPVAPPELNPTNLMLVNDLDMRLTDSQDNTYKPYILDPENPEQAAATGDNFRDNVEQILVDSPDKGELFTITIDHKGNLANGDQDFALIITGMQPGTSFAGGSSSEWDDPDNWTHGAPEEIGHIIIPADATHYPVISTTETVQNLSIEAGASLTIAPGGSLTVTGNMDIMGAPSKQPGSFHAVTGDMDALSGLADNPVSGGSTKDPGPSLVVDAGATLTVDGTLANEGDIMALVVASDASGTGSLIHHNQQAGASIQRYIEGDWSDALSGWHLLSSPVTNQLIEDFIPPQGAGDYDFYAWDEQTNTWRNQKAEANGIIHFNTGHGYLVSWENTYTSLFTGEVHVNDVHMNDLSLTDGQGDGWHLLGNPFSSGLAWDASAWDLQHIVYTAKVWDDGTYLDIPSPGGVIPAMNGFFVQVETPSNSLTIPSGQRVHDGTRHKSFEMKRIVLEAHGAESQQAQQAVVRIEADAAGSFDPRYDSRFLAGYGPVFYALKGEEALSTISVPAIRDDLMIPLVFHSTGGEDSYEISLAENIPDTPVYITDRIKEETHPLSYDTSYVFEDLPPVDGLPRFELHFGGSDEPTGEQGPDSDARLHVWYHQGRFLIKGLREYAELTVYNSRGREVSRHSLPGEPAAAVNAPHTPGLYVLVINKNKESKGFRVVVY